jgi:Carboxypeptidase regulatory-like domain
MRLANVGTWLSLLAVAGILFPTPIPAAEIGRHAAPLASDVQLAADGSLPGIVLDAQGHAIAGTTVCVSAVAGSALRAQTDEQGRFRIEGLHGGVYQAVVGDRTVALRVWTPATAPPGAQRTALLVVGGETVRGQTPLPDYVRSDAFLITVVVVGAIAIPIAIHNFRNDQPAGS